MTKVRVYLCALHVNVFVGTNTGTNAMWGAGRTKAKRLCREKARDDTIKAVVKAWKAQKRRQKSVRLSRAQILREENAKHGLGMSAECPLLCCLVNALALRGNVRVAYLTCQCYCLSVYRQ